VGKQLANMVGCNIGWKEIIFEMAFQRKFLSSKMALTEQAARSKDLQP
jgi:hypothetical protein